MNYDYAIDMNNKNNAHTLCINFIEDGSKVLDIGCSCGNIGNYLSKNKNCELIGIDICQEALETAKSKNSYKQLMCINLDNLQNELDSFIGYFDYILMADIIEHVYHPEKIIEKMKTFLNSDGKFILSIPNIAHASTKLNLVKNQFEYTEMGLLDKTHIRFFTKNSIINLMNDLNLKIEEYEFVLAPSSTYYEPIKTGSYKKSILNYIEKDDYSFVYQYILKVSKNNYDNKNALKLNKNHANKIKTLKTPFLKQKEIFNFIKRKPLFLFRKDFYELLRK